MMADERRTRSSKRTFEGRVFGALGVFASIAATGCLSVPELQECYLPSECPQTMFCSAGRCVAPDAGTTGPADAEPAESGIDSGMHDTGAPDTSSPDTFEPDAGQPDAEPADAEPAEVGPMDADPTDTGPMVQPCIAANPIELRNNLDHDAHIIDFDVHDGVIGFAHLDWLNGETVVYFNTATSTGPSGRPDLVLSSTTTSVNDVRVVWDDNTNRFLVGWNEIDPNNEFMTHIRLAGVDMSGRRSGATFDFTGSSPHGAIGDIVIGAGEIALFWYDTSANQIWLTPLNPAADMEAGSPVDYSSPNGRGEARATLGFNGEYVLSYTRSVTGSENEVEFVRINAGTKREESRTQLAGAVSAAFLANPMKTDSNYVTVWTDGRLGGTTIHFAATNNMGVQTVQPKAVTSNMPFVTSWGRTAYREGAGELGLVWQIRDDGDSTIGFTRIDTAGNILEVGDEISGFQRFSRRPRIRAVPSGYMVMYGDLGEGAYLVNITCQ